MGEINPPAPDFVNGPPASVVRRVRYSAKKILGPTITRHLAHWKQALHRRLSGASVDSALVDSLPWCSPNTFELVVASYRRVPSPHVHEYGSGASTLRHLRTLLEIGGTLVSVEHDQAWARRVRRAAQDVLASLSETSSSSAGRHSDPIPHAARYADDLDCRVRAANGLEFRFVLKVRPPAYDAGDADGTREQYREYVGALTEPADLVIVDGRARKACVQHVLDNQLLRTGGALALFEAGRGIDGWLDAPALDGTSDYQPEVDRMVSLGATLVDGTGYDSWPMQLKRRSFGSLSRHYPLELCLLQLPKGSALKATAGIHPGA